LKTYFRPIKPQVWIFENNFSHEDLNYYSLLIIQLLVSTKVENFSHGGPKLPLTLKLRPVGESWKSYFRPIKPQVWIFENNFSHEGFNYYNLLIIRLFGFTKVENFGHGGTKLPLSLKLRPVGDISVSGLSLAKRNLDLK
jgi:ABC-type uncharacterized transport system permease subunit